MHTLHEPVVRVRLDIFPVDVVSVRVDCDEFWRSSRDELDRHRVTEHVVGVDALPEEPLDLGKAVEFSASARLEPDGGDIASGCDKSTG